MYDGTMYREGLKGLALLFTALFLAIFFGWKQGWAAACELWIPIDPADAAMARADEVLRATHEMEQEPHVSVARRFLAGDMDADISVLGRRGVTRLVALRSQGFDISTWTDKMLLDEIRSSQPSSVVPRHVRKAAEDAYDEAYETRIAM